MIQNNNIASFVKYQRKRLNLTQEELSERAGVGLRFIRDLEQGKESLRLDKVNQVLSLFGHRVAAFTEKLLDPYDILWNNYNRSVEVELKDRAKLVGILVDSIMEESDIVGWKFVSNNNAVEYRKTGNPDLVRIINHRDIDSIQNLS